MCFPTSFKEPGNPQVTHSPFTTAADSKLSHHLLKLLTAPAFLSMMAGASRRKCSSLISLFGSCVPLLPSLPQPLPVSSPLPPSLGLFPSRMHVQSCPVQLFVTLWTLTHQAPLSMEFSSQEYWNGFSSAQFSCSVMSDSLRPHEPQLARPPCPSPTPGVHSDSRPSSQ